MSKTKKIASANADNLEGITLANAKLAEQKRTCINNVTLDSVALIYFHCAS